MRYGKLNILICFFILAMAHTAFSQIGSCQNAQNACASPGFSLTSTAGTGLPSGLNVSNPQTNPQGVNSGCLLTNGPGPNWMILTVSSSGMLAFSFGANSPTGAPAQFPQTGFYDWAMWPYDANTCTNIFNNTLPPIACCWNGSSSGGTGMGTPPPGASPFNFQPSIPVTVGQQFIILLSNYSGVTTSVTINSFGSANISCSPLVVPSVIRCPSQQAAITATWAANVTGVTYTIAASMPLSPGNFTVQSSPTFIVAPPSTHVYTVFASGNNTMSAVVTSSNTFTVTISPTTTMDIVASPNPTTMANQPGNVCYGTSAIITALSPGTNFTLTGPNNLIMNSNIQTISTPTLSTGGSYTVATSLFSGCTATGAVQVNVAPNYTLSVNPPINVCMNGTANLTASMPTATSYVWTGPNGFYSGLQNPSINYIQLLSGGVYTVAADIIFNGIACRRTATTQVNVVPTSSVTINPSPDDTLCQGVSLRLLAGITGTAGFLWQGPSGFNTSSQTTTVSGMMPANAGIYTVTAIFSNGAISCPRTNTINIHVVPTSQPTINLIPHNICQHDVAHLGVITSTAATASYYQWIGPNAFSSGIATPTFLASDPNQSGVYYVNAYFTMGPRVCVVQAHDQINVVQVSTIAIIPPPPVCRPDNVPLFSSAVQAISYTWAGPNNFVDHQANPVLFHPQTTSSGIYTVTVAFGGGALVCYNTNTVSVTINPSLIYSLTPYQQPCYNQTISIPGPVGATGYSWTSSSGFTSNQQDVYIPHAAVSDRGTYTLSASLGSCVTTHTAYVYVIGKIQEIYSQQNAVICKGDSINLKSEVAGGNESGVYAFIWTPSIYLNSPNVGVQSNVKPQGSTFYNVQAFDPECPEYKISHNFSVTVLTAARPDLALNSSMGCEPFSQLYYSKVPKNGSIVTYDFIGSNGGVSKRVQNDSIYITLPTAGTYALRVKTTTLHDEENMVCADSSNLAVPILVFPKPGSDVSWLPEQPTLSESDVTFMGSTAVTDIKARKWVFGGTYNDTTVDAVQRRLFQYTGKYSVMLISTTQEGCTDTVKKTIEIKDDFNVFIPNTFTPNGDNLNDVFMVKGAGIKTDDFSMTVFDRWGVSVFSTKDPTKGWDGSLKSQQIASEGMYVYKIVVSGANGEGKKEYIGQVTLVR